MRYIALLLLSGTCWAGDQGYYTGNYPPTSKVSAPAEFVSIPFSTSGWHNNGQILYHSHLLEHGCPQWVINKFANNPLALHQIHDGYHAKENGQPYHEHRIYKDAVTTKVSSNTQGPVYETQTICNGRWCRQVRVRVR